MNPKIEEPLTPAEVSSLSWQGVKDQLESEKSFIREAVNKQLIQNHPWGVDITIEDLSIYRVRKELVPDVLDEYREKGWIIVPKEVNWIVDLWWRLTEKQVFTFTKNLS